MRMEKISVRCCVDLGFNDLSINIGRASPDPSVLSLVGLGRTLNPP